MALQSEALQEFQNEAIDGVSKRSFAREMEFQSEALQEKWRLKMAFKS